MDLAIQMEPTEEEEEDGEPLERGRNEGGGGIPRLESCAAHARQVWRTRTGGEGGRAGRAKAATSWIVFLTLSESWIAVCVRTDESCKSEMRC